QLPYYQVGVLALIRRGQLTLLPKAPYVRDQAPVPLCRGFSREMPRSSGSLEARRSQSGRVQSGNGITDVDCLQENASVAGIGRIFGLARELAIKAIARALPRRRAARLEPEPRPGDYGVCAESERWAATEPGDVVCEGCANPLSEQLGRNDAGRARSNDRLQ